MGAAGMATTAAGMAGAAMMGGAQSIAGGAQAIMAVFSKANTSESGGSSPGMGDLMSAAGGAAGGSGGDRGGSSALASAMGDSGGGATQATGGSSLGAAPGEVKPGSSRAAAVAAKVGRVAAGTATNLAQGSWDVAKARDNQEPAFGGDSLSGTSDEVSAFVNKAQGGTGEQMHDASVPASAGSSDSSTRSVFDSIDSRRNDP